MSYQRDHDVLIDGVETRLTLQEDSPSRGYVYHTPGHASAHSFRLPLVKGERFRTNGHHYEVLT